MSGPVTGTVTGSSVKLAVATMTFEEWQVNQDTVRRRPRSKVPGWRRRISVAPSRGPKK